MTTDGLVPVVSPPVLGLASPGSRLLADFQVARSPLTIRAYATDLRDFARCIVAASPTAAIDRLLASGPGEAYRLALQYQDALRLAGRASATIARRLATLRSLVRVARRVGLVEWTLDIPGPKRVPYRDTRGPGRNGFLRLVAIAEAQREPKRSRDLAILWLLYGRALRRSEACRLQVPADLDLAGGRIRIHGKHRADPEWVTVPPAAVRALQQWLSVRGDHAGPLFTRCDHAAGWSGTPQSLSGDAIWVIVRSLGDAAGIRVRPHGLRHAAVTEALAATNGDIRSVQRFARLTSTTTIQVYDDERADLGGEVSRLLAP